jgi:iron complex outermembrane recepter protein
LIKQLLRLTPIAAAAITVVAHAADAPADAPAAPDAAASAPAADNEAKALDAVVVRSRNRIERLQDVPLSISVVQGTELERLSAYGIDAITRRAANVSWNLGNQRTSSLSIRGVGKIGQTEAQDPSVGVIVDGVNYAYNALTSSFNFVDVDTVEVTRGPQGTLLGKNTSLGVVNVTTRRPSFTPTADYTLEFRQRGGFAGTAAVGGPVVDDLIAWRGSFSVDRGQGDIENQYNRDITYTNTDRVSGRVQFLVTPSSDFNARLAFDLQPRAGETTNGRTVFTPTPTTYANGSPNTAVDNASRLSRRWFSQNTGYSVGDYYAFLSNNGQQPLVTGSRGASAELNWKLDGGHTLTSISAYKDYHFDAVNDEGTPFDVYRNAGGFWNDYRQASQELRISSAAGGFVDYQGGLYYIDVHNEADYRRAWGNDAGAWFASNAQYNRLDADPAGRLLMLNSLANLTSSYNSPVGVQEIRNKSAALFAQANWHLSEPLTLTTGLRFTREDRQNAGRSTLNSSGSAPELNPDAVGTDDAIAQKYFGVATYAALTAAQKQQVADARAIRKSQLGVLFGQTQAEPFRKTQPAFVISPSYKTSEQLTAYFSYQHGEKAGISQLVNGVSTLVQPEKTNAFEAGFKSALFDKTLVLNADVFLMNITDYQQSVRIVDQYTTALNNDGTFYYTSATGNVPKVRVSGLEVDGVYAGIANTTLRFSGAYNKAIYKDFRNAAQPVENGYAGASPYRDISGQPLAGAPKYSVNVGGDYRLPVRGDKVFHTSANVSANSSYYSDNSLSAYSVIPKSALVDWAIGVGTQNRSFDVSLIVKNLFNDDTPRSKTWNSSSPAIPRSVGIQFAGKL